MSTTEQPSRLEQIAQTLEHLAMHGCTKVSVLQLRRDAEYLRALDARTPAPAELHEKLKPQRLHEEASTDA